MQLETNCHADDESLEQYSKGSLAEPALAELEEHLLVCSHCRERLEAIDSYVAAMRGAAAKLEHADESRRRFWTRVTCVFTFRRLAWAMAVAAVVLAAVAVRVSWIAARPAEPFAMLLKTSRGAEIPHAPAGRPLDLRLDITGLAPVTYQVEIVNAAGERLAESHKAATETTVRTGVSGLRPGTYFIRLYSPSRDLLREYGLQVD